MYHSNLFHRFIGALTALLVLASLMTAMTENLPNTSYFKVRAVVHKVHTLHTVKSAVSLKWQVGFKNDMKITPIVTITFSSKMLLKQCFTSLEHTFLDDSLNSL